MRAPLRPVRDFVDVSMFAHPALYISEDAWGEAWGRIAYQVLAAEADTTVLDILLEWDERAST